MTESYPRSQDRPATTLQPGSRAGLGLLTLALLSVLGACQPQSGEPPAEAAERSLPTLQRVAFPGGLDTAAWEPREMAVITSGEVIISGDFGAAGVMLHLIQPQAESLVSFGRYGAGPGELGSGGFLFGKADTLIVWDYGNSRLLSFTAAGKLIAEHRTATPTYGLILDVEGDSVDVAALPLLPISGLPPEFVWRQSLDGQGRRMILSTTEPLLQSLISRRFYLPTVAISATRVAVADPLSYSIQVYDKEGRSLYAMERPQPPLHYSAAELEQERRSLQATISGGGPAVEAANARARLDTLDRVVLPRLSRNGLQFDDQGRLWAIGRMGDSTFVDVFADSVFLGRLTLPCYNPGKRVALEGRWLALLCSESLSDGVPRRLQVYQIQEAPQLSRG